MNKLFLSAKIPAVAIGQKNAIGVIQSEAVNIEFRYLKAAQQQVATMHNRKITPVIRPK